MADDGLIAAYLRELAYSVRELSDAEDIVVEAADHLYSAAEVLAADSAPEVAQAEALARFGSAALIARVCISESRRGAAVPTTRTRQAGLAAVLAPLLVSVGQVLNVTVPKQQAAVHGIGIVMIVASLPAALFGMWGLVHRHGGLGRLGQAAFGLATLAAPLSLFAGWAAIALLGFLFAVALAAVSVQMLRAGVLPVTPIALVGGGAAGIVASLLLGGVVFRPLLLLTVPSFVAAVAGFMLLGLYLWREPAIDSLPLGPVVA